MLAKAWDALQMRDEELKKYKQDLEVSINEVLKDAPQIKDTIQAIREKGYDVFLMVEATIGFNKCEEGSPEKSAGPGSNLNLSSHDEKFLRQLKISPK